MRESHSIHATVVMRVGQWSKGSHGLSDSYGGSQEGPR
jgi:hypothetical protein